MTVAHSESVSTNPSGSRWSGHGRCWLQAGALTKPRLALLSTLTGMVGFAAAPESFRVGYFLLFSTGTFLCAASAMSLNQWMEYRSDALMRRTAHRPIPSGGVIPRDVLGFGVLLGLMGVILLAVFSGLMVGLLGALTIVLYVGVYTPLKRRTPWCTQVGTLPGALPPVMGWWAASGGMAWGGWLLFLIMVAWQMPHFNAVSWMCREDYRRAGLRMRSVTDPTGQWVKVESLCFAVAAAFLGLLPFLLTPSGWTLGWWYAGGALAGNAYFLITAWRFAFDASGKSASLLFRASLVYLPLVFGSLILDLRL